MYSHSVLLVYVRLLVWTLELRFYESCLSCRNVNLPEITGIVVDIVKAIMPRLIKTSSMANMKSPCSKLCRPQQQVNGRQQHIFSFYLCQLSLVWCFLLSVHYVLKIVQNRINIHIEAKTKVSRFLKKKQIFCLVKDKVSNGQKIFTKKARHISVFTV